MFDSLKKVEGSKLEAYIKRKCLVFGYVNNITNNRLVRELSDAYFELERSLQRNTDYGKVKDYCKESLHPLIDITMVNAGRGIAVRDVIHFIETGDSLLPDDFLESMVFIEENNLVQKVVAEVTRLPSPEEERRRKHQEAKKKAFEDDVAKLEKDLYNARNDLHSCPTSQKKFKEAKVKHFEQVIADLKKSGEPLNSIVWT